MISRVLAGLVLLLVSGRHLGAQVTLTLAGSIANPNNRGEAHVAAISTNSLLLANGSDGLRLYDISTPANPISVSHTNNGATAYNLAISGHYAYLANLDDGLRIYDISNPTNPVNTGHIFNGGLALGVAVSGNYAYLANDADGLRIYDVSNPAKPVNIGHASTTNTYRGTAARGGIARNSCVCRQWRRWTARLRCLEPRQPDECGLGARQHAERRLRLWHCGDGPLCLSGQQQRRHSLL